MVSVLSQLNTTMCHAFIQAKLLLLTPLQLALDLSKEKIDVQPTKEL